MNILHINNYHYLRGGADSIYFKTAELLESHGHSSLFFSMHHTENLPCNTGEFFVPYVDLNARHSITGQLKIAGRILYSFEARKLLSRLLDKFSVDIAHIHNIYHALSPSILHELEKRKIPIVMSVHDPKLVCGSHNMYVNGRPCDACSGGRHFMAIIKRCVKDSLAKSTLVALEMYLHHNFLDIYHNVNIFIFTSLFFKNKFKEMGFKKKGIHLLSLIDIQELIEFDAKNKDTKNNNRQYVIYVGNLLLDKGLLTLLDAAKILSGNKIDIEVKISGNGPIRERLYEKVRIENIENIRFLGRIPYNDLCQEIKNSIAVVLPAENYENNPVSIMEAFALGKPAIGSRLGGIPELIKDSERGLTFEPGNPADLASKIIYLRNNPEDARKMGDNAKIFIEKALNAETYYKTLMEIYKRAVAIELQRK